MISGAVIAVLVMLSLILTLSVLFPGITETEIVGILIGGSIVTDGPVPCAAADARKFEPASAIKVNQVKVYWSDQNGDEIGTNHNLYTRGGTFT